VEIWWICDWNITYPQVKQMAQSGKTLNSSSALLSMNSTLVFSAVNTNQFRVTYSAMVVNATYQDVAVGHTLVPAFGQEAHSNVSVPTLLIMDKVSLVRPTGADLLEDATNDQFPLYLTGRMDTCVHTFGFKSPSIHVCCVCTLPQFGLLNSLCVVGLLLVTQTFDGLFFVGWDLVSEILILIVGWTGLLHCADWIEVCNCPKISWA